MRSVRPFDGRLLQILQGLLGRRPLAPTVRLLKEPVPRPRGLSRSAVELIQDELSKGMVLWLARSGGWERQRFLRDGRPDEARAVLSAATDPLGGLRDTPEMLEATALLRNCPPSRNDAEGTG